MCLFHQQVTALSTPSSFGIKSYFNNCYLSTATKSGLNLSGGQFQKQLFIIRPRLHLLRPELSL